MVEAMNLAPGSKLDALIAEKVMGLEHREWKPYYSAEGWYPKEFNKSTHDEECPEYEPYLPDYSYSIAPAWQVVEKLWKEKDIWITVVPSTTKKHGYAAFDKNGTSDKWGDYRYRSFGDTAPHAICLAALKALAPR